MISHREEEEEKAEAKVKPLWCDLTWAGFQPSHEHQNKESAAPAGTFQVQHMLVGPLHHFKLAADAFYLHWI